MHRAAKRRKLRLPHSNRLNQKNHCHQRSQSGHKTANQKSFSRQVRKGIPKGVDIRGPQDTLSHVTPPSHLTKRRQHPIAPKSRPGLIVTSSATVIVYGLRLRLYYSSTRSLSSFLFRIPMVNIVISVDQRPSPSSLFSERYSGERQRCLVLLESRSPCATSHRSV